MSRADDDRILREMQAPDIEEALEALGFWLERRGKLPFYRRTARAEAHRMIGYWQGRVLSDAPRAPMQAIGHARELAAVGGQLVAYRAGHVARRGALTVVGVAALTFSSPPGSARLLKALCRPADGAVVYSSEDPAAEVAEVQREVRWMRRRPLLAGVVLLALLGFSYWFVAMGGGASGSAAQAEQAIRNATATAPGQPISGSQVVAVRCSENGASMLARLASIFQGGSASEQQRATPATYYSCSGTTVDGTAMDWCVGFPPKSAPGNVPPQVLIRQPGGNCPT